MAGKDAPLLRPSISSEAGLIWTSNAEQSASGASDWIVSQDHAIAVSGGGDQLALRGTLTLSQTRHQRLWVLDSDRISLQLEGRSAIAPDLLASGYLRLGYDFIGDIIDLGEIALGARSGKFTAGMGVGLTHIGERLTTELALELDHTANSALEFIGVDLAPTRLSANHQRLQLSASLMSPLAEGAQGGVLAKASHLVVSDEDRFDFGRAPASLLRLGGQISATPSPRAALSLAMGADILASEGLAEEVRALPFGQAELAMVPLEGLALRARFETDTDIVEPADGVADWRLGGSLSASIKPAGFLTWTNTIFTEQTRSVATGLTLETTLGAKSGITLALADGAGIEGTISHKQVDGLAPAYEETRVGLRVRAAL